MLTWVFAFAETTAGQQATLSTVQGGDTISQLTDVQQKNKYAQLQYSVAAVKLAQEGASNFAHGGECKLSCPYGCCDSSDGLIYQGGVFMLLNSQATMQSRTHQLVAKEACETSNKFAVSPKNCATEVKPFDVTKPAANWFDEKGKCKPNAPADCIIISLIPGSSVFGTKGVNCKKNSNAPCADDFFSTYVSNPDGSVTIKTSPAKSVKLTVESFKSLQSLLAAGVPSELADSLLSQFAKIQKKVMGNSGADLLASSRLAQKFEPEKSLKASDIAEGLKGGATETVANAEKPAKGESLTKNFRGEAIHIWSANIFEVMSNRYKKTSGSLLP